MLTIDVNFGFVVEYVVRKIIHGRIVFYMYIKAYPRNKIWVEKFYNSNFFIDGDFRNVRQYEIYVLL